MKEMTSAGRQVLIEEAKMQTDAINRLGIWLRAALSLMAVGLLLAWRGLGMGAGSLRGVSGIAVAIAGAAAAVIIRQGRNNGKKNVERILNSAGAGIGDTDTGKTASDE